MNGKNEINSRYVALKMCLSVIDGGRSLSQVMPEGLAQFQDARNRSFTQNLVLGTLRWQLRLQAICDQLLKKKLKAKDEDINQLILLGLYQILYMETPDHAAVSETVALVSKLKKPWAKGLVNGVLRNFLRDREALCAEVDLKPSYAYSHPQWFFKTIRKAYPQDWQQILSANNEIAPITLRNNRLQQSRDELLESLNKEDQLAEAHPQCTQGIRLLQSMDITGLPGFTEGAFSVQDGAAQQAAELLQPIPGERLLDACAAPGGKTAHLLELADGDLDLLAIEKEPERLDRLAENLHRLGLECDYRVGDAAAPGDWWNHTPFDKILLDAPCSATGIIRRRPDIKWHRTEEDISALCNLQAQILETLWTTLKPGGRLLYATCSVLPQENGLQMQRFLQENRDAREVPITAEWGLQQPLPGRQILPGDSGMDGFYYCLLEKTTG
ncbi:16S rRNA (cytosine(967)-C(5))-methyltransferase RsmB [Thiomicrorhabdus sp.]|uniref:16S rRNA (cytosine(967)-C(5))-methyltransferase RsmB n=1 Tax=Thiomicrorhabdus sp. TaxID=2039724 RepID=UPI0029C94367|nr:16S rRNA (cytosine(967)-C(5))-methyltransferase RsmB [Thiomicrorhabdus sp.]